MSNISEYAQQLRSQGMTWGQIAERLRKLEKPPAPQPLLAVRSALSAMRKAHSWTRTEAAERWNALWPGDGKIPVNFAYWEGWEIGEGYPPSMFVLLKLAELYQCSVSDLFIGVGDYRHLDEAFSSQLYGVCGSCGTPISSVECPPNDSPSSGTTPSSG